jgi:hypothetical protein
VSNGNQVKCVGIVILECNSPPAQVQLIVAKGKIRDRVPIATSSDILVVARFPTGKSLFRLGA